MEIKLGLNAIDAANEAGVRHFIFSTLENPGEVMKKGKYKEAKPGLVVPHFQTKAAIADHLRKSGMPYTLIQTSFFFESFLKLPYLKYLDGSYAFFSNHRPDVAFPGHSVEDIGGTVTAAFAHPKNSLAKTVPVKTELVKFPEALNAISKATGTTFLYRHLSANQFWNLPLPGGVAKDFSNMFLYYSDFPEHLLDVRDAHTAPLLGPSFSTWVQVNKAKLVNPPSLGVVGTLLWSAWLWVTGIVYG